MNHIFHPSVIREYDIRGIYNETLTEKDAYALGRAFAETIGGGRVAVARDGRVSSLSLQSALMDGLEYGGCDVVDIGLGPTPMLYFAVKAVQGMAAGIMVTGSHNPAHHNGFKMMRISGSVHGEQIKAIAETAKNLAAHVTKRGSRMSLDIKDNYVDEIVARSKNPHPDPLPKGEGMRVIWDCGNGAAGAVINDVLARLDGQHMVLFGEVDGRFPNHHPDPTVEENLKDLQSAVREHKADIGLAFDGDADRLGVVDENARFIPMDDLIALLAADVLRDNAGAPIIADVKCAPQLFDEIARLGGKPILWRTGHSPIKSKMIEENAPFAGEYSGHLFFADRYFGFDDGIYAGLRVLDILKRSGKTLSQLLAHLPSRISKPEMRLDVDDAQKFQIVDDFVAAIQIHPDFPKDGKVITIDGIRVETLEGWLLIRASNTQAALVMRVEGVNEAAVQRLQRLAADVFRQLKQDEIADKVMS